MDRYDCFATLRAHERAGLDFTIGLRWGSSGVAVMVPHGGRIEPGTSEIGRALAGANHTFYEFAGIKPADNFTLHIRSERFDEPQALEVIDRSRILLVVHGCAGADETLYVGGRASVVKKDLVGELGKLGLTMRDHPVFRGKHPDNLCNRPTNGGGIQLEFSAALRKTLLADQSGPMKPGNVPRLADFSRVVNGVMARAIRTLERGTTKGKEQEHFRTTAPGGIAGGRKSRQVRRPAAKGLPGHGRSRQECRCHRSRKTLCSPTNTTGPESTS